MSFKRVCYCFILLILLFPTVVSAGDNLIKNSSFEEGLNNWISTPSTATFLLATDNAKIGTRSATITKTTSSSFAYFYQRVPIEPNTYYQLSGNVIMNDLKIDTIKLRLYFLDDKETKIQNIDAITQTRTSDWQLLQTDTALSPTNAISAEVEGYVLLSDKNPSIPAQFDGLSFLKVIPTPTIASPSATPTPTLVPSIFPTPTLTPISISYDNVYISEAMTYPNDGENEWVEIYNGNTFTVSLNNWYIDDEVNGGSSPKLFSLTIPAQSYGVVDLSTSMFNNDGDSIRLLDFNKNPKDSVDYSLSQKGKSWGKKDVQVDTLCIQEPSKTFINNICIMPTVQPTPTTVILSTKPKSTNSTTIVIPTIKKLSQSINTSPLNKIPVSITNNKQIKTPINTHLDQKQMVLGESTIKTIDTQQVTRSLSFASFGMAILTIAYIGTKLWRKIKFETV